MSSLPIALLRGNGGGSFSRDPRFAPMFGSQEARKAPPAEDEPDPLMEAYSRGFDDGSEQATESARREACERDAQRTAIELAFARLDEETAADLRERLRLTVLALCEETILPLALDPDGLAARIEKAVAMLQRSQDERRVLLHPDDLALVEGRVPTDLTLEACASVERGALRIETDDGGIEDGPAQWRRILGEAFREC
jgi:flagellar assembly protein FliH